jgi:hypothetical protein
MRTLTATFVGGAQRRPPRALIGKFDPGKERFSARYDSAL